MLCLCWMRRHNATNAHTTTRQRWRQRTNRYLPGRTFMSHSWRFMFACSPHKRTRPLDGSAHFPACVSAASFVHMWIYCINSVELARTRARTLVSSMRESLRVCICSRVWVCVCLSYSNFTVRSRSTHTHTPTKRARTHIIIEVARPFTLLKHKRMYKHIMACKRELARWFSVCAHAHHLCTCVCTIYIM